VHYDLNIDVCDICHFAKEHKLPFPHGNIKSLNPFNLIQEDIWGPISIPFVHKHRYFLTVVDDYTRYSWISFMKIKSKTRTVLYNFVMYIKNQFDHNITIIRSGNDKEFIFNELYVNLIFYIKDLVLKSLDILNITRSLMFQSGLPKVIGLMLLLMLFIW